MTLCREKGHQVFPFNSAPKAVEQLDAIQPQVVITDIKMETMSGFDVLRHVREHHRQTSVILITAYASVDTAIEAMKMGAYDYVPKPFKIDELQMTIQRALDYQAAVRENVYLRKELKNKYRFENIIGTSRKMQLVYNLINKVADTDSTVLIQGESGTGKELVARGLHFNSNRQHHPFVAINCSALPENLLESELFGHKKGAFTGAVADKRGFSKRRISGTIFLDEVNSMAPQLQTKLLRVLQEREVRRVGDNKSIPVNVRVVGATNEPLQPKTERRNLSRRSLLPAGGYPGGDSTAARASGRCAAVGESFFAKTGERDRRRAKEDRSESGRYSLPLRLSGQRARAGERDRARLRVVRERHDSAGGFAAAHRRHCAGRKSASRHAATMPVGQTLDEFIQQQERGYIEATLAHCGGSREKAASMLGISMATLYRKVESEEKVAAFSDRLAALAVNAHLVGLFLQVIKSFERGLLLFQNLVICTFSSWSSLMFSAISACCFASGTRAGVAACIGAGAGSRVWATPMTAPISIAAVIMNIRTFCIIGLRDWNKFARPE